MSYFFYISTFFFLLLEGKLQAIPHFSDTVERSVCGNDSTASIADHVKLLIKDDTVLIDNGILQLIFTKPGGRLIGLQYNGIDNLLELHNPSDLNGGFWDLNWSEPNNSRISGQFDGLNATSFEVIVETNDQVELSFLRTWDISQKGRISPLNVDKRFVMLRGCSGFYSYAIYEHSKDMPAFNLFTTRIAFMLSIDKFHYMAMADNRQRFMPSPYDRLPGRGQPLAYKEAVKLVNPLEEEFKGEVDDKYLYSTENKDNHVHGWICQDPAVGFWQITPSNEFRTGGPFKQDLTSHVNPTTLAIFVTPHYAGKDLAVKLKEGEEWKKVFGPVFIYLNSAKTGAEAFSLWDDAKIQMNSQIKSWPYTFPASKDFLQSDKRGKVIGRLLVEDSYLSDANIVANGAYVGLATPGDVGSWQRECKGYQFWTRANEDGSFVIENVREGNYNLYASIPGFIGDYRHDSDINITGGDAIELGDLIYHSPRDGPTLWEIGIPDRSAAEFYIPDPNPLYVNKLYLNHSDRFRQYGLWERYAELYPDNDLIYTVGVNDYKKDWFFAQVTRKISEKSYNGTTWQIRFKLENVHRTDNYTLRLALASAHVAELEVRINGKEEESSLLSTGVIGGDNAIARHGIHGIYWLFNVSIPPIMLMKGQNTIFLAQVGGGSPFKGLMYDYIRLEGPPSQFV
ncbi:probable rhamnogalacturonate lyase B [Impatiens glandulifera]|uniref:probable rhamnogalacturonate lyase B n=1 Tax=Impatiens glandulifera TaxID=253017 RepID=UPI001FB141E3|nr:probable rhamnogalacturonate lyase B [Impatiens glandulifera]